MRTYSDIMAHYQQLCLLESVQSLAQWDFETIMPSGASPQRQAQLAAMAAMLHDQTTAPYFVEAVLREAENSALAPLEQQQLRKLAKSVLLATAVDRAFTELFSAAQSACGAAWREARAAGDYARLQPLLAAVLALTQEWCDRVLAHDTLRTQYYPHASRYEVLLDQYEPGFSAATLAALFADLQVFLTPQLLAHITDRQPPLPPANAFALPMARQQECVQAAVRALGFDLTRGRIDISAHPFCGGPGGDDVRLTTRYREDTWIPAIYGILHETGHGLYEQHLPSHLRHTPCGRAASLGIHESQSRFFENCLARSHAGCAWLATVTGVPADTIYHQVNHVQRSLVRVEADEVTYNLHIAIRMQLERQLIDGSLAVADLPEAWNAHYQQVLGITPPGAANGCMQDVHWYWGTFGYFPTYTLGNLIAAQLFANFRAAHPDWESRIAAGDFAPARAFMQERIYAQAALADSPTTIEHALSAPLRIDAFAAYVREKYLGE